MYQLNGECSNCDDHCLRCKSSLIGKYSDCTYCSPGFSMILIYWDLDSKPQHVCMPNSRNLIDATCESLEGYQSKNCSCPANYVSVQFNETNKCTECSTFEEGCSSCLPNGKCVSCEAHY